MKEKTTTARLARELVEMKAQKRRGLGTENKKLHFYSTIPILIFSELTIADRRTNSKIKIVLQRMTLLKFNSEKQQNKQCQKIRLKKKITAKALKAQKRRGLDTENNSYAINNSVKSCLFY